MGQAKQKGTFQQRLEHALKRDALIAQDILADEQKSKLKPLLEKHGIRKTVQLLQKIGLVGHSTTTNFATTTNQPQS
jgi:hypothetical protein